MTQPKDPQEPKLFWIDTLPHSGKMGRISFIHTAWSKPKENFIPGRVIKTIDYSAYQALQSKLEKAEAENKRLREALDFYAQKSGWYYGCGCCKTDVDCEVIDDQGERARQALKGEGDK